MAKGVCVCVCEVGKGGSSELANSEVCGILNLNPSLNPKPKPETLCLNPKLETLGLNPKPTPGDFQGQQRGLSEWGSIS